MVKSQNSKNPIGKYRFGASPGPSNEKSLQEWQSWEEEKRKKAKGYLMELMKDREMVVGLRW